MVITISSCIHRAITHFSRASSFVPTHTHGGSGMGGWVGGWGGIMTFGTTSGHIVSVDGHHHFIMHSSCHFSRTSSFVPTHTHGGYGTPADVIALAFETLRSLPLFSSSSSSELPGHYMEDFLPNCIHCWAGMLCESRLKVSRQSRCANSNRYIDGSVVDIYIDTYRKLHFNTYNNACICFNWTVIPNSWTYF